MPKIFVVQKHNSSHHYYDLRFVIGGVLKRFAILKTPPDTSTCLCCSSYTSPAARPWCFGPGAVAHAMSVGWGVVCGELTSTLPPPSLSALFPAIAACQGGRVTASRMDSCEFRTAD